MPHGLRLPAVRHMDCRIPQTCIARREPHYSSTATPSAQRSASNTEAYRQKSTPYPTPQPKNSKQPRHNVSHPTPKHTDKSQHRITHHNPRTSKKKPEGCAEGPWLYGPFAVFHSFPKQKNQALCQEIKTKTKNQPDNKQRKRKSQRKIKKKNKRKNKGEKA